MSNFNRRGLVEARLGSLTHQPTLLNPFAGRTANTYCGTSETSACGQLVASQLNQYAYTTGESIPMAISVGVFNNETNTTDTMLAEFFPLVDQYTLLDIPSSVNMSLQQPNITLNIITQGGFISLPPRQWSDGVYVVGFRSVVITLTKGNITDAVWDDGSGCSSVCPSGPCVDNACLITQSTIDCGTGCDIKIYVTWQGTDKNGNVLTSANYAYYQFQRWWPFAQITLVQSIAQIFQNLGNGGLNELNAWL